MLALQTLYHRRITVKWSEWLGPAEPVAKDNLSYILAIGVLISNNVTLVSLSSLSVLLPLVKLLLLTRMSPTADILKGLFNELSATFASAVIKGCHKVNRV